RRLLTADANGHVKIWETGSWTQEADITQTTSLVSCAAFSPDGKRIAFGDYYGALHIWDLEQKKAICDSPTPAPSIGYVSYSPDGKRLITTHAYSNEHLVMIWDTASWVSEPGILSIRPKGEMIWDTESQI